jgi:hypothetical protein
MSARRHNEHAALVEGRGVEAFTPVATVAFVYPDDGEIEPPVVRDRWTGGSILQKCQRPFAPVPSGDALSRSMLDMRLSVLIAALRQAMEELDVAAICQLADKLRATSRRIEAENLAAKSPTRHEVHGDIVIVDDAERGKVLIQLPAHANRVARRLLRSSGFYGSGDGMNFWRRRIFRHGSNVALLFARSCVEQIQEVVTGDGKDSFF